MANEGCIESGIEGVKGVNFYRRILRFLLYLLPIVAVILLYGFFMAVGTLDLYMADVVDKWFDIHDFGGVIMVFFLTPLIGFGSILVICWLITVTFLTIFLLGGCCIFWKEFIDNVLL